MDIISEKLDFGDDESTITMIESLIKHECDIFSVEMMDLVLLDKCSKSNKKNLSKSAFKKKIRNFECFKKKVVSVCKFFRECKLERIVIFLFVVKFFSIRLLFNKFSSLQWYMYNSCNR